MNLYLRQRIDREDELRLLYQIAVGDIPQRILLIKAEAGMGKSELLREFIVNHPNDAVYAVIDFKNGGISQTTFLYNICESLGWENFPKLRSSVNGLLELPSVNVSENILIGQNHIGILLGSLDKQDRESYLTAITKAFFDDVRALTRVVFILDTYEKADQSVQEWLTNIFLHYALGSPNLVVIISGRYVPEPAIDWADLCREFELQGIEAIHWYGYAQSIGITVSLHWIEGCCFAIRGHPLQMAQILSSFPREIGKR